MSDDKMLDGYRNFLTDYKSDYDQKPTGFEIWQASAAQSAERIEELEEQVALLEGTLDSRNANIEYMMKQIEQLQAQVAGLNSAIDEVHAGRLREDKYPGLLEARNATTQTAESYKRRIQAEALEEAARKYEFQEVQGYDRIMLLDVQQILRRMASELLKEGA